MTLSYSFIIAGILLYGFITEGFNNIKWYYWAGPTVGLLMLLVMPYVPGYNRKDDLIILDLHLSQIDPDKKFVFYMGSSGAMPVDAVERAKSYYNVVIVKEIEAYPGIYFLFRFIRQQLKKNSTIEAYHYYKKLSIQRLNTAELEKLIAFGLGCNKNKIERLGSNLIKVNSTFQDQTSFKPIKTG